MLSSGQHGSRLASFSLRFPCRGKTVNTAQPDLPHCYCQSPRLTPCPHTHTHTQGPLHHLIHPVPLPYSTQSKSLECTVLYSLCVCVCVCVWSQVLDNQGTGRGERAVTLEKILCSWALQLSPPWLAGVQSSLQASASTPRREMS